MKIILTIVAIESMKLYLVGVHCIHHRQFNLTSYSSHHFRLQLIFSLYRKKFRYTIHNIEFTITTLSVPLTITCKFAMLYQSVLKRELSNFSVPFIKRFYQTHNHFANALFNQLTKIETRTFLSTTVGLLIATNK